MRLSITKKIIYKMMLNRWLISNFQGAKMTKLVKLAHEELNSLISIRDKLSRNIIKFPEGTLNIKKYKDKVAYIKYLDKKSEYIKKKDFNLARQLAQKSYYQNIIKMLDNKINVLLRIIEVYKENNTLKYYESLNEERRNIISPIELTWEQAVKNWYNIESRGNNYRINDKKYITKRGEFVRSKSEKIIADILFDNSIEYKYEMEIFIKGFGYYYPDFTILDPYSRKEVYWEHLGLSDDIEYMQKSVNKINLYKLNNIYLGENLILTYENSETPINSNIIELYTERFKKEKGWIKH